MMRRLAGRALLVSGLAGAVTLLARPLAMASDVFQNIGPASPLGSAASFARYPLSHYEIDEHFTAISASLTGGLNTDGLLPMIAYFFASELWHLTAVVAKFVIELFAFAFSLDLVNGSEATGGAGALGPVSSAIHSIYANVFGAPWLVLAFSGVGLWAMWKALVQRRYSETAGALALSLLYIVVALFFVAEPAETIGQASRWTNEMSQAFLSISDHGSPSGGEEATADDADQLWGLLVERPWAVLEFGGLEHCVLDGTGDADHDPTSVPVRPLSRDGAQNAALSRQLASGTEVAAEGKACINNENKYSSHFLSFGSGTDERNAEYDALNHGDPSKLPEADEEKAGYRLGVADKPATDAMEEGGQSQRLWLSVLIAVGELGAILLLGSLALGVILSQVLLLLLLAFSPVALVAAAIPGRGHDFFKSWLEKLAGYLLRKAAYSLVLAVLLALNVAISGATSQLGWLFSFGLQAAFFWAVLIQRRTLAAGIVGLATGSRTPGGDLALDAVALYAGARLGLAPIRGAGRAARGAGGSAFRRYREGRREPGTRRLAPFFGTHQGKELVHGGQVGGAPGTERAGSGRPEATVAAPSSPEGRAAAGGGEGQGQAVAGEASTGGRRHPGRSGPPETAASPPSPEEEAASPGGEGRAEAVAGEAGAARRERTRTGADSNAPRASTEPAAAEESAAGGPPERGGEGSRESRRADSTRRQPLNGPEVGRDGVGDGAMSQGSDLSDELRAERERPEASAAAAPSGPEGAGPPDGGSSTDAPAGRASRPTEEPSAPPRRRPLRRLWGRRK